MPVSAQRAHAMTSFYEKKYKEKYGSAPVVNRYSARWGWDSVLMSMSEKDARDLIEYYFDVARAGHPLEWFFYNYDKLLVARRESVEDAERRRKLRAESQRRAEEWRNKIGNKGITSN